MLMHQLVHYKEVQLYVHLPQRLGPIIMCASFIWISLQLAQVVDGTPYRMINPSLEFQIHTCLMQGGDRLLMAIFIFPGTQCGMVMKKQLVCTGYPCSGPSSTSEVYTFNAWTCPLRYDIQHLICCLMYRLFSIYTIALGQETMQGKYLASN